MNLTKKKKKIDASAQELEADDAKLETLPASLKTLFCDNFKLNEIVQGTNYFSKDHFCSSEQ